MSASVNTPKRDLGRVGTDAVRKVAELATWQAEAREFGVEYADRLKTLQDRLAFLHRRDGLTAAELARRLGKFRMDRGRKVPDRDWVLTTLGLTGEEQRSGAREHRLSIRDDVCLKFARELGLDPRDVGL